MAQALTATSIFGLTLYLVIAQPKRLNNGIAALLGAALAFIAGAITLTDIRTVVGIVWDATFALVGIMVISVILDQAGFFRWVALKLARRARGDGRAIFRTVILLGAAVSILFTNDATVLILTPIVYEMLAALGFDERGILPYMMACGFVADSMSIPLAVSNLTNMIIARYFAIGFVRFALVMLIPGLVCLGASMAVLYWYYRRDIPTRYDQAVLPEPASAIRDPFVFKAGVYVLGAMVVAFFINSALMRVPVSFVITGGAVALLLATLKNRVVEPAAVVRQAPWHVVLFAVGMYLVVYSLGKSGLTAAVSSALRAFMSHGLGATVMGTGIVTALLSGVMNNLPGVTLGVLAVEATQAGHVLKEGMVLATVVGVDVGPKLTPIGSLATLIWLHGLRAKGLNITWRHYFRTGIIITVPVLLATLAAVWFTLSLVG